MMDNIVLIGMPGAGKSTIGVILAKRLGLSFADTDLILQQRTGRMLQEIINTDGADAFLALEREAVRSFVGKGFVVATGGSVVLNSEAMTHLQKNNCIVYLEVDFAALLKRIHNMVTRGILLRVGQSLKDVYLERKFRYESYADITVNTTKLTLEQSADRVFEAVKGKYKI